MRTGREPPRRPAHSGDLTRARQNARPEGAQGRRPQEQGAGSSRTTTIRRLPTPTPASTWRGLWTLRGTQTPATATHGDALGGRDGGIGAGQRTGAHGPDAGT